MPPRKTTPKPASPNVRAPGKPASGKVLLRMPIDLHQTLLDEAHSQGTTANTLANTFIASGLRWRDVDPTPSDKALASAAPPAGMQAKAGKPGPIEQALKRTATRRAAKQSSSSPRGSKRGKS